MNYIGTKKLETERLILRPTEESDLKILWSILGDKNISKYYLTCKYNYDWEKELPWQNKKLENALNPDVFQWSIVLKSNNECIGQICCQNGNIDNDSIRDVGWFLDSKYHGMGYGSEAARCMIDYMFNKVMIDRIDTSAAVDNPASWKLMEKIGFEKYTEETHKTKYTFVEEEVDCYSYRLTKNKYNEIYK